MAKVLVACEFSGVVREAFRARGHQAWSCDLLPSADDSRWHIRGDALDAIIRGGDSWDLVIAHPPCTYLCASGLHWNKRRPERAQQTEAALAFVRDLWTACDCAMALENPIGALSTRWRKPDQIIQPWQYGHGETKATCLWLRDLPLLRPTQVVEGRDNKVWRMPESRDRWAKRSVTYQGIAEAMAAQWGALI